MFIRRQHSVPPLHPARGHQPAKGSVLLRSSAIITRRQLNSWALLIPASLGLTQLGCRPTPFVWANDIPAERAAPDQMSQEIQSGDTVSVVVTGQAELSADHVVSADGTIVLQNLGPVTIAGMLPKKAQETIKQRLATILSTPQVSISIVTRRIEVGVLGEVERPGTYMLKSGDGVPIALAQAGGLTEFAGRSSIYLVRASEKYRIRFRMKDLVAGGASARAFALRDGDLLVVE